MGGFSRRAKGVGCIVAVGVAAGIVAGVGFNQSPEVGANKPAAQTVAQRSTQRQVQGAALENPDRKVTETSTASTVSSTRVAHHNRFAARDAATGSTTPISDAVTVLPNTYLPMYRDIAKAVADKKQQQTTAFDRKSDSIIRALTTTNQSAPMVDLLAQKGLLQFDTSGRLTVTLTVKRFGQQALAALADYGFEMRRQHNASRRIEGVIAPEQLTQLAELPNIEKITATQAARVSGQGNVHTEGDELLSALQARAAFGVQGNGVKICVISDGIQGAEAAAQAGELPVTEAGRAAIGQCGVNAQDNLRGAEGTAMLEVIYDLAPQAELAFCSGVGSEIAMVNAINYFSSPAPAGAGCDVILDDLSFLMAPYFQEGDIAQAAKTAVDQGIVYISAAGNAGGDEGTVHYEGAFNPTITKLIPGALGHIFSSGGRSRRPMPFWAGEIEAGGIAAIALQWGEPFGQAGQDLDLYVLNDRLKMVDLEVSKGLIGIHGTDHQNGNGDPFEFAVVQNLSGRTQTFYVLLQDIHGVGGALPLEMFVTGNQVTMRKQVITSGGSIVGHAGVKEVITVGAINASTPGLAAIAPYVSQGPAQFLFSPFGQVLPINHSRRIINKPDLVAVDGVSVSGAGGFAQSFFGTSASAPHVAAIAALMLEANPNLSPNAVKRILTQTADARGNASQRNIFGSGLVNAESAVALSIAARPD